MAEGLLTLADEVGSEARHRGHAHVGHQPARRENRSVLGQRVRGGGRRVAVNHPAVPEDHVAGLRAHLDGAQARPLDLVLPRALLQKQK